MRHLGVRRLVAYCRNPQSGAPTNSAFSSATRIKRRATSIEFTRVAKQQKRSTPLAHNLEPPCAGSSTNIERFFNLANAPIHEHHRRFVKTRVASGALGPRFVTFPDDRQN